MRLISNGRTAALLVLALGLLGCAMASERSMKETRSGTGSNQNQFCSWTFDKAPSGKVIPGDAGTPLSNEGSDLHNTFNEYVDVAERKTVVLQSATTEIPAEFTRVSVQPSGGGEGEDATPAP